MSALVSLPRRTPTDEILEVLARDGCVILENVADAATVDAVATDLAPDIARTPTGTGEFVGHKTRRTHTVLVNSPTAGALALHPAIEALNDAVLGPFCARYQLSSAAAIAIGPEETRQELHRDDLVYPLRPSERAAERCHGHLGAYGFYRSEWGNAGRAGQPSLGRRAQAGAGGGLAGRDAARLGRLHPGLRLSRGRRQPRRGCAHRPPLRLLPPAGCGRSRTSTSRCRRRSRGLCPSRCNGSSATPCTSPSWGWHDLQDPIELLRGYEDQSSGARDLIPEGQAAAVQGERVKRS